MMVTQKWKKKTHLRIDYEKMPVEVTSEARSLLNTHEYSCFSHRLQYVPALLLWLSIALPGFPEIEKNDKSDTYGRIRPVEVNDGSSKETRARPNLAVAVRILFSEV